MDVRLRRWRLIVDWGLQGSLAAHSVLHGVMVLAAVGLGVFLPLLVRLGGVDPGADLEEHSIVLLYLHERFWLLSGICLVVIAWTAVRMSHRVAGPLVRYKRNLRLVAEGKLPPPLRTRRGDHLQAEVACLNAAVAGVAARVDAIRRAQVDVRRKLADALDRAPDSLAAFKDVVAACDALERAVREFQHVETLDERPASESARRSAMVAEARGV